MKNLIDDVMVIHIKMGAPRLPFLDYTHAVHRMNFLLEELTEMTEACGLKMGVKNVNGKDLPFVYRPDEYTPIREDDILDGLIDLIYVAVGTGIYFGYHNMVDGKTIFQTAWDRVQAANATKIPVKCASESKRGVHFDLKKPEGWKPPTFLDLIQSLKERGQNETH